MKKKLIENIWYNLPLIPKCIKIYILVFIILVFILMLDIHCIFSISFVITWFSFTLYSVFKRKQRIASTYNWKKIRASVIAKKIQKGNPFISTPLLPYVINIIYRYTYDTCIYQTNTFAVESCMEPSMNYIFSQNEANNLLKELIKDNHIDIYINPDNPSDSIIMQGMSATNNSSYFSLVILFLIPALLIYAKCFF